MAAEPPEVPPGYFYVRLGDLPRLLEEQIAEMLNDYGLPLILDNEFIGSGVLVRIDGVHGILTAEHVVNNPHKPFDNRIDSKKILMTSVAKTLNVLSIPLNTLDWFTTTPQESEWGPDLAFIRLPENTPFLSELKHRKTFWDLTRDTDRRRDRALDQAGFLAFVGYPGEWMIDEPREDGYLGIRGLCGVAFMTGQKDYVEQSNGFDFYDVGVDRSHAPSAPKSFGGVSGGGLWRFFVSKAEGEPNERIQLDTYCLAGLVYFEIDVTSEFPAVRGHGPRSLYNTFLTQVRTWLNS